MQITLKQADIEAAVKRHVAALGISRDVVSVTFTSSRKGGFSIGADVEVSDGAAIPAGPIERCTTVNPAEAAVVSPAKEAVAEDVTVETPAVQTESEPASTEPPFDTDTVADNDAVGEEPPAETKPAGKSLFS